MPMIPFLGRFPFMLLSGKKHAPKGLPCLASNPRANTVSVPTLLPFRMSYYLLQRTTSPSPTPFPVPFYAEIRHVFIVTLSGCQKSFCCPTVKRGSSKVNGCHHGPGLQCVDRPGGAHWGHGPGFCRRVWLRHPPLSSTRRCCAS
jgi:hypothetical protein